jgi:hypothetical protein
LPVVGPRAEYGFDSLHSFEAIGTPNLALTCSNGLGKPKASLEKTISYSNFLELGERVLGLR